MKNQTPGGGSPGALKDRHAGTRTAKQTYRKLFAASLSVMALGGVGVVVGAAGGAVLAAAPMAAPAAQAADYASGHNEQIEAFGGSLGSVRLPNGSLGYCIHPASGDAGGSTDAGTVGGYVDYNGNALPANALQQLNFVFSTYGQQEDLVTNQAVSLFSYAWTGRYDSSHLIGSAALGLKYLAAGHQGVADKFQAIWNDAQDAAHYSSGASTGSGALQFTVDPKNNFDGTVTMVGTAGSTGTIVLKNGVFKGTDADVAVGVAEGSAVPVISNGAVKADGALAPISGTGTFTPPGSGGYDPNITVNQNGGGQDTGTSGTKSAPAPFQVAGFDPTSRRAPSVSTTAHPAEVAGGSNYDNYTVTNIPSAGVDLTIDYYAGESSGPAVCTKKVYTFTVHIDQPASAPYNASGRTDEFVVLPQWIDDVTGKTNGHFIETVSVPGYSYTHASECGAEGENTVMTKPVAPSTPPTPPTTPPTTPAVVQTPPAPVLPVVAG